MEKYQIAKRLSVLIAFFSGIASFGGLFFSLYRDNELVTAAWKGNDLITLFVVVPVLIWSILQRKKNYAFSKLVMAGALGYVFYNYVFYLFASALNNLFLVYVFLVAASAYAFVFLLLSLDEKEVESNVMFGKATKFAGSFMLLFSIPWTLMEISRALSFVVTQKVPFDVVQTGHPTAVVYAADLTIVMPGMIIAAILMLKKRIWGYIFSTIILFKGVTYGLALVVMSWFAKKYTGFGDPLVPVYYFLSLGSLISYFSVIKFLLKNKYEVVS